VVVCAAAAAMLAAHAAPAAAQSGDPASAARVTLGPIALSPSISIPNIGYDSNVFYDPVHPVSDLTATIEPKVVAWIRAGRGRVTWNGRADAFLFKQYSDQNTINTDHTVRADMPFGRLRLSAAGSYVAARERPGFEIDERVRRTEQMLLVGAQWQLNPVTSISAVMRRSAVRFDSDATFDNQNLAYALNRQGEAFEVGIQHALTPLSSIVGSVGMMRDSFDSDRTRDSGTRRVGVGFAFKPLALVTGRVEAGLLTFQPNDPALTSLTVPNVSGDIGYTLRGVTHLTLRIDRGVNYSIDDALSYYLQTGISGSVIHHVRDDLTLTGTVMRQLLDYRAATAIVRALPLTPATVVMAYDAGLGQQLTPSVTWGIHVGFMGRSSNAPAVAGNYDAFRFFFTVGYGLHR
jgi:hypothetical protein